MDVNEEAKFSVEIQKKNLGGRVGGSGWVRVDVNEDLK